jgi:hypothetical protein
MVAMATSLRKAGRRTFASGGCAEGASVVSGAAAEQGVGEFEGDGGSAEVLVGVGAAGLRGD